MEYVGSWGLIFLGIAALVVSFVSRRPASALIGLGIAAVILYAVAGFNPNVVTISGVGAPNVLAFFAGIFVGVWGWLLFAVLFGTMFPLVHKEHKAGAFFTLVAITVMLYFLTGINIALLAIYNPWYSIPGFIAYVGADALWSRFKWRRFLDDAVKATNAAKRVFIQRWKTFIEKDQEIGRQASVDNERSSGALQSRGFPAPERRKRLEWLGMDTSLSDADQDAVKAAMLEDLKKGVIPQKLYEEWHELPESEEASWHTHKELLIHWIMFWPWSLLTYLFFEFLYEFFEEVWKRMGAFYQKDVDEKYAGFEKGFLRKAPTE